MTLLNQFKDDFLEFGLNLAWQHWTTLGVDGQESAERNVNVDPEALVLLTGFLGESDSRLVDNVMCWLMTNEDLVFKSRLKTILDVDHPATLDALYKIFDRINETTDHARWQSLADFCFEKKKELDRVGSDDEESSPINLESNLENVKTIDARLSSNRLRLRKLFGTSTRAELLNFFLAGGEGSGNATANDLHLSQSSVYTILQDFLDIGLLDKQGSTRNTNFHFLRDNFDLHGLGSERFFDWPNYFSALITAWGKIETFEEADTEYKQRSALGQFNQAYRKKITGWNEQFRTSTGKRTSADFMEINEPAQKLFDEITSLPDEASATR